MAERLIKIRFASTNSGYNDSHMHGNLVILSSNFLSLPRFLRGVGSNHDASSSNIARIVIHPLMAILMENMMIDHQNVRHFFRRIHLYRICWDGIEVSNSVCNGMFLFSSIYIYISIYQTVGRG